MESSKIHILEELPKAGGSLDGENIPLKGYVPRWWKCRRATTLNVCGTYSDLSLSLEIDNASVLR